MSWTIIDYLFGQSTTSTSVPNNGSLANVPADGSAPGTVVFSSPFPTACTSVNATIDTGASDPGYQLSLRVYNRTKTGFSVIVTGGPAGSMVSVDYSAQGN